jgi:hypothetical protein
MRLEKHKIDITNPARPALLLYKTIILSAKPSFAAFLGRISAKGH